jgi:hypothetical protein
MLVKPHSSSRTFTDLCLSIRLQHDRSVIVKVMAVNLRAHRGPCASMPLEHDTRKHRRGTLQRHVQRKIRAHPGHPDPQHGRGPHPIPTPSTRRSGNHEQCFLQASESARAAHSFHGMSTACMSRIHTQLKNTLSESANH